MSDAARKLIEEALAANPELAKKAAAKKGAVGRGTEAVAAERANGGRQR